MCPRLDKDVRGKEHKKLRVTLLGVFQKQIKTVPFKWERSVTSTSMTKVCYGPVLLCIYQSLENELV